VVGMGKTLSGEEKVKIEAIIRKRLMHTA